MGSIDQRLATVDWGSVRKQLTETGYAIVPGLLTEKECNGLVEQYGNDQLYRKKIVMERYRFGQGEYKYFNYPLPGIIHTIRETVYPQLAPVANSWMKALNIGTQFPARLEQLQALCRSNAQDKPTVLILQYGAGGYNTLHQDLYGDIFFPMQTVLFLDEPGKDYNGGQFVMIQQNPRAQSKVIVLQPRKGDMVIFTTNFRPVKGNKGYYRVNMKHGVSEITSGRRHTLGIIFHDATT